MRIVIEIDGQKITAIGPEAAPAALEGPVPPAGRAPAALLARAKKLGAMSAGAAQFGTGAALATASLSGEQPARKGGRARAGRKRARRRR